MQGPLFQKMKNFDAYPKTLDEFRVRTYQGGLVLALVFVVYLALSELKYFMEVETIDKMLVDGNRGTQVTITFDIDFPRMPCSIISVEAGDMSGNVEADMESHIRKAPLDMQGNKKEQGVLHEMGRALKNESEIHDPSAENEKEEKCLSCYGAGREGQCCNTCEEVQRAYSRKGWTLPSMHTIDQCADTVFDEILQGKVNEGCNIQGTIDVPKVAGKIYFAPSSVFQKGYLSADDMVNLTYKVFDNSHVINTLAFGELYPEMKNPLNARRKDLKMNDDDTGIFQYYLKVVSTEFKYLNGNTIDTNQFSVTEHFLKVSPKSGRGLPSVSFSYEFAPIMFRIEQHQKNLIQFVTSVCAIVGGVFTMMGILDSAIFSMGSSKTGNTLSK